MRGKGLLVPVMLTHWQGNLNNCLLVVVCANLCDTWIQTEEVYMTGYDYKYLYYVTCYDCKYLYYVTCYDCKYLYYVTCYDCKL